jgi:hypothetical protein
MIDQTRDVYNELHDRRSLPWIVHLAAVLVLCVAVLVRFLPLIAPGGVKADEEVYLEAFQAVAADESPYAEPNDFDLKFYYPPAFASLGAAALKLVDSNVLVAGMRVASVLGLACCLWCSALFAPLDWRWCLAAAALYAVLGPVALLHGLGSGNLSFAAVGAGLVALAGSFRAPAASGLLLGLSTVTKPIAAVGIVAMGVHRPIRRGRAHLVAAGTGLITAGTLTLASPFLAEFLALDGDIDAWPLSRSVSLYRWLHLMGLHLPPVVLAGAVAAAVVYLARRAPIDHRQLFILATVGMTLATPALWSHTLLLVLPLEVMALGRGWKRLKSDDPPLARRARFELVFVALAVAALQFVDGIGGGLETARPLYSVLALAVPVWAPVGLGLYVWGET